MYVTVLLYVDWSVHIPPCTLSRNYACSLMMICDMLSKHVEAVKVFWCK